MKLSLTITTILCRVQKFGRRTVW